MLVNNIKSASIEEGKAFVDSLRNPSETQLGIKWPLPNMRRVTEADFWSHRATWTFAQEANCGHLSTNGKSKTVLAYFVNHGPLIGGGFAIAFDYWADHSADKVQYYTWRDCDHKFVERNLSNCYNEYKCSICQRAYTVDSSD